MGVKEFREINWLRPKKDLNNAYAQIFLSFSITCLPHTHPNYTNLSITATTREGQIADYNYHTEIPAMVIKLFLSWAQSYGIIYLLK